MIYPSITSARRHNKQCGAAISEYLPIIGVVITLLVSAVSQYGFEARDQGANVAMELAGAQAAQGMTTPGGSSGGSSGGVAGSGGKGSQGSGGAANNGGGQSAGTGSSGNGQGAGSSTGAPGSSGAGNTGAGSGSGAGSGAGGQGAGNSGSGTTGQDKFDKIVEWTSDLVAGMWDGIKTQFWDLVEFLTHPIDTALQLKDLAVALFTDFESTMNAIVDELGAQVRAVASGDAHAIGQLIGENISPTALVNVVNRVRKMSGFAKAAKRLNVGCSSFLAGTEVWTPQGMRAIEQLQVGDWVYSRNDQNYADAPKQITRLLNREVDGYYQISTGYDVIRVTEEHPFWLQGSGWTEARQLKPGNALAVAEGDILVRASKYIQGRTSVYNFEVEDNHSYFVSHNKIWVHNANDVCDLTKRVDATNGLRIGDKIAGFPIQRVRMGTNGKVAIIGGPMKDRVNPAAMAMTDQGVDVVILDDKYLGGKKYMVDGELYNVEDAWKDMISNKSYDRNPLNNYVTNQDLPNTPMYKLNQQWIREMRDEGYTIVDLGSANDSLFYDMEIATVKWD